MQITLSPQVRFGALSASVSGHVYTLNGEPFDFSFMADGDILPADAVSSDLITGEVKKIAGEIHLTQVLPVNSASTDAAKFPGQISITSGEVEFPA